jgi:hypothetical protein
MTGVSRVYNSTTGETYTLVSFTTNTITVSGINPPLITDVLQVDYYIRSNALVYKTLGNAGNTNQSFGVFENDEILTLVNTELEVDSAQAQAFIASDGAVLMSIKYISDPNSSVITVTYFVHGETGDKDILVSDFEHLEPGTINVELV